MSWLDRVLHTMQTAAVIGERVKRMSNEVADLAVDMRELDRRVAQLEDAFHRPAVRIVPPTLV